MREAPAPILIVTGPSGVGKSTVSRLVAATLDEKSTHVRIDDFTRFVVNGWVEPWLPESAHQNEVLGGAVAVAAMQFAQGGYTVVVDGHVFLDSLEELARACLRREVPLHYAVLRCDLGTCLERATNASIGERPNPARFADLHARFDELGEHERNVVEATGKPDEVAAAVLAAFRSGRLAENASPLCGDR
jgi:tRNA uridine 5-carbamoylmethylation protein Kti12